EGPGPGHAFEFVFATGDEVETGADHQRRHSARYEHLTRGRECRDASADVNGYARYVATSTLYLAGMRTCSNVETGCPRCLDHLRRAADRAGGTVERRHEPVARGVHFDPAMAREDNAQLVIVTVEQLLPVMVAQR